MEANFFSTIDRLSDSELCAELKRQARCEQRLTASVIAHLARFQERRLYLGEGYSSAFAFCTQALGFSESAAYNRTTVARVVRKFPLLLEMISSGEMNLTGARLLVPHLTPENHEEVLGAARNQRKMQLLEIIARVAPRPAVPSSIRKLPDRNSPAAGNASNTSGTVDPRDRNMPLLDSLDETSGGVETSNSSTSGTTATPPTSDSAAASDQESGSASASASGDSVAAAAGAAAAASGQASVKSSAKRPATITPLAPELYKFECTVNAGTYAKLRRLQALLRHQIPNGDLAEIFDRALGVLLKETERKQLAATDRPRQSRGVAPGSRAIPAAVKRAVRKRDGERCAFVAADGHPCGAEDFLQWHHVDPHGAGGPPTVANVEIRCQAHNLYEAEQYFGPMKPRGRNGSVLRESPAVYDVNEGRRAAAPDGLLVACQARAMNF